MLHPDTELEFINAHIGYGVVATRPIPKGTITWVRCSLDQTFSAEDLRRLGPLYGQLLDKYCFVDGRGDHVLCWDLARFINHSCEANCLSPGYSFEVAVRDIGAGEELLDDYGSLNLDREFNCACGSPRCRRQIRPDDMNQLADQWDGLIREPFMLIGQVAQPLWEYIPEQDEIQAVLEGRDRIRSTRANFAGTAADEPQLQAASAGTRMARKHRGR